MGYEWMCYERVCQGGQGRGAYIGIKRKGGHLENAPSLECDEDVLRPPL